MEDKIKEFLQEDRNGYGNGDGFGFGKGNGFGFGKGNGFGGGYGCGARDGNGFGNRCGDGYGYGGRDGNGFGFEKGSGCGDGYGGGIKEINGAKVYIIDCMPTIIAKIRGNIAKGFILEHNVYLKECYVVKGQGHFAHGETLRKAQQALEEKIFDNMEVEERIELFIEQFKLGIKYPAKAFYEWHNKLTGSCEMGRQSFAKNHGINIENDMMTVEEFIELTKDSYGGNVIVQLAERMGIKKGKCRR